MSNAEQALDWVKNVSTTLREDPSKALRVDRSGYIAFTRHAEGYHYEVIQRHYDDDEWSRKEISQTQLTASAARFSHQAEIVDMPDLDTVEVTLDE